MTFKLLFDIGFWTVVAICSLGLIWELISDGQKKFWKYQKLIRRDRKKNRRRKWKWTFRTNRIYY